MKINATIYALKQYRDTIERSFECVGTLPKVGESIDNCIVKKVLFCDTPIIDGQFNYNYYKVELVSYKDDLVTRYYALNESNRFDMRVTSQGPDYNTEEKKLALIVQGLIDLGLKYKGTSDDNIATSAIATAKRYAQELWQLRRYYCSTKEYLYIGNFFDNLEK